MAKFLPALCLRWRLTSVYEKVYVLDGFLTVDETRFGKRLFCFSPGEIVYVIKSWRHFKHSVLSKYINACVRGGWCCAFSVMAVIFSVSRPERRVMTFYYPFVAVLFNKDKRTRTYRKVSCANAQQHAQQHAQQDAPRPTTATTPDLCCVLNNQQL